MKAVLKKLLPKFFTTVIEVLGEIEIKGWRIRIARNEQGKVMSITITRE